MYIPAADGRPRESSVECVIILVDYAVFLSDPSFQMPGDRDKLIKVISPWGLIGISRTGAVAMTKGPEVFK